MANVNPADLVDGNVVNFREKDTLDRYEGKVCYFVPETSRFGIEAGKLLFISQRFSTDSFTSCEELKPEQEDDLWLRFRFSALRTDYSNRFFFPDSC